MKKLIILLALTAVTADALVSPRHLVTPVKRVWKLIGDKPAMSTGRRQFSFRANFIEFDEFFYQALKQGRMSHVEGTMNVRITNMPIPAWLSDNPSIVQKFLTKIKAQPVDDVPPVVNGEISFDVHLARISPEEKWGRLVHSASRGVLNGEGHIIFQKDRIIFHNDLGASVKPYRVYAA